VAPQKRDILRSLFCFYTALQLRGQQASGENEGRISAFATKNDIGIIWIEKQVYLCGAFMRMGH
jgi:hypothetical protein